MDLLSVTIIGAIVLALGLNSLVIVPPGHIAVPTRFGRKTRRALGEGWRLKLPLLDTIREEDIYPANAQLLELRDFEVRTQRIRTTLDGVLVWKPDFTIRDGRTGQIRFIEMYPVARSLEGELRGLILDEAGKLDGEYLVGHVQDFNDTILRRLGELGPRFGIRADNFVVTRVGFPEEVEDALQETKRAELRRVVAEQQILSLERTLQALREAKAPEAELNAALVFLGRAKQEIKTARGINTVEVLVPQIQEILRPLLPLLFGRSL